MSKRFFVLITLTSLVLSTEAQTWDEWFNQRRTQERYLAEQIAALKVYTGYLEQGYRIAREGWQTVASIKDGTFSLHDEFIGRLAKVNPELEKSHRLALALEDHYQMLYTLQKARKEIAAASRFDPGEKAWLLEGIGRSIREVSRLTAQFQGLLTDDHLDLSDNERMDRLMSLVDETGRLQAFVLSFLNRTKSLDALRHHRQRDTSLTERFFSTQ
ncbi:hypothetical protein AB9P05_00690 [Roseivirga sp. BDSF3-8]|uniref:hypothetical protein n=1 Tax=Roseivirga sp. BDSF3-8 TaxID=3241598 RepID=UPI003532027E